MVVADHLHLDVAGGLDVALQEHGAVAEGGRPPRPGGAGHGLDELVGVRRTRRMPRPPPPADALTSSGQPTVSPAAATPRRRPAVHRRAGQHRHAGRGHHRLASIFEPMASMADGGGPDEHQAGVDARPGERRRSRTGSRSRGARRRRRCAAPRRRGRRSAGRTRPARRRRGARPRRPRRRTARRRRGRSTPPRWRCPAPGRCGTPGRAISPRLATSSFVRTITSGRRRSRGGPDALEWTADRAMPSTVAGVAGVDDAVVVEPRRVVRRRATRPRSAPRSPSRCAASASSSNSRPAPAADWRATIDITPASCCGPMTAVLALGQVNRKRGS